MARFVGFVLTGASSMLAESFHSVADSGNQAMLLAGGRVARRGPGPPPPVRHGGARPSGRRRAVHPGSLFSFSEGYEKLRHPHELESAVIALAILVVAPVLEGLLPRTILGTERVARWSSCAPCTSAPTRSWSSAAWSWTRSCRPTTPPG